MQRINSSSKPARSYTRLARVFLEKTNSVIECAPRLRAPASAAAINSLPTPCPSALSATVITSRCALGDRLRSSGRNVTIVTPMIDPSVFFATWTMQSSSPSRAHLRSKSASPPHRWPEFRPFGTSNDTRRGNKVSISSQSAGSPFSIIMGIARSLPKFPDTNGVADFIQERGGDFTRFFGAFQ